MTEKRSTPDRPLGMLDPVRVLDGENAGYLGVVRHSTPDNLEVVLRARPADKPLLLRRDQVEWDDTPPPLPSLWDQVKWIVIVVLGLVILAMLLNLGLKMAAVFPAESTPANTSSSAASMDYSARAL